MLPTLPEDTTHCKLNFPRLPDPFTKRSVNETNYKKDYVPLSYYNPLLLLFAFHLLYAKKRYFKTTFSKSTKREYNENAMHLNS